jgi:hypothetical protein
MIAFAVFVGIVFPAFLFLATANIGLGPPPVTDRPIWSYMPVLGVMGVIVGLAWMVRIYRADPEPDQHAWRYRAKR